MQLIHKIIIKDVLKYIAIILILVAGVYIAVDFFEKIDDFIEADLPFSKLAFFFVYKTPFILEQVFPISLLISVLITFGIMSRNNEITALKSGGISAYYLLLPVVVIGVLSSILLFFVSEEITPFAMSKANTIFLREVRKEKAVISKKKNIWIKGSRTITHINYYDADKKTIFGIMQTGFNKDFKLIKRIDAEKGIFNDGEWILSNVIVQIFDDKIKGFTVKHINSITEKFDFMPENLRRVIKKTEEMSFAEMYSYIKNIEAEGYAVPKYRTDLHAKISFPFVCILMVIIGTGAALKKKAKENLAVNVAYGIAIAFFYWVFHSFSMSLGYGDILLPFIAAWLANIIFLCIGLAGIFSIE